MHVVLWWRNQLSQRILLKVTWLSCEYLLLHIFLRRCVLMSDLMSKQRKMTLKMCDFCLRGVICVDTVSPCWCRWGSAVRLAGQVYESLMNWCRLMMCFVVNCLTLRPWIWSTVAGEPFIYGLKGICLSKTRLKKAGVTFRKRYQTVLSCPWDFLYTFSTFHPQKLIYSVAFLI